MKILVTGKNGQLGKELCRKLSPEHELIALGKEDVDLGHEDQMRCLFRHLPKFSLVINCAAYTDVDRAESEPDQAERLNADAVELLAQEALRRDIPMIHFSTDYVFDGQRRSPYTEKDRPNPLSVYGKSKLEGEIRIQLLLERHLIFRLSGLYGNFGRNFLLSMLGRFYRGKNPKVARDQTISPNCTKTIADGISKVIRRLEYDGRAMQWGTYHLSGTGGTTWYDFAKLIFEDAHQSENTSGAMPIPVSSEEYGAAATRPEYSILCSDKFRKTFGIEIPDWRIQYRCFMQEISFR